jgi:DNA polymerase I
MSTSQKDSKVTPSRSGIFLDCYSILADPNAKASCLERCVLLAKSFIDSHNPHQLAVSAPAPSSAVGGTATRSLIEILHAMGITPVQVDSAGLLSLTSAIVNTMAGTCDRVLICSPTYALSYFASDKIYYQEPDDAVLGVKDIEERVGIPLAKMPKLVGLVGDTVLGLRSFLGPSEAIDYIKGDSISGYQAPREVDTILAKNKGVIGEQIQTASGLCGGGAVQLGSQHLSIGDLDVKKLNDLLIKNKCYAALPESLQQQYQPKTNMGSQMTFTSVIETREQAKSAFRQIRDKRFCAVVFERDGEGTTRFGLSVAPGNAWTLDLNSEATADNWRSGFIRSVLENSTIAKVSHNSKELYKWSWDHDMELEALFCDSAVLAHTLDANSKEKTLFELFNQHVSPSEETLFVPDLIGERADIAWRVGRTLHSQALNDGVAWDLFKHYDRPLIPILGKAERKGLLIDTTKLIDLKANFEKEIEGAKAEVTQFAGSVTNLDSPIQVSELLYSKLNLPVLLTTPSGSPSTSSEVLQSLSEQHEVPGLIFKIRSLTNALQNIDGLLLSASSKGRVHASFFQNATATGRLSCRNPNLLGIPSKSEEGQLIREAVIAPKGRVLISADYSQAELRFLAHLSKDRNLIHAFNSGVDIHKITASVVLGLGVDDVSDADRRVGKTVNFGLVYGLTAHGLAKKLGTSEEQAGRYISGFFEKFSGVKAYIAESLTKAQKSGFVTTVSGRKLFKPGLASTSRSDRSRAERAATNAPMQGGVAEIMKKAMRAIERELQSNSLDAEMILQVHDELVVEANEEDAKKVSEIVVRNMESAITLAVPLVVDVGVGQSWSKTDTLDLAAESGVAFAEEAGEISDDIAP